MKCMIEYVRRIPYSEYIAAADDLQEYRKHRSIPDGKVRNMAKYTLLKTAKKCVLCRHWNGAMGSTMIQMKTKDYFQVEMTEKQTCYRTARTTQALNSCSKFEPRYKEKRSIKDLCVNAECALWHVPYFFAKNT